MAPSTAFSVISHDDSTPSTTFVGMTKSNMKSTGEKICCRFCEKMKDIQQFSNNNVKKYREQSKRGKANPKNSGVSCRQCTGEPLKELVCEGPCNRTRPLSCFSKNSRRTGKYWCIDCTQWQEAMEPGKMLPPPGMMRSADEIGPKTAFSGIELHDDFIFDNDDFSSAAGSRGPGDATSNSAAPFAPGASNTKSMGGIGMGGSKAPHWELPELDDDLMAELTQYNHTQSASSATGSAQASAFASNQNKANNVVSFNAYDSNGVMTRMTKAPTVYSETQTNATERTVPAQQTRKEPLKVGKSGWLKIPGRKTQPEQPSYLKYDYDNANLKKDAASDNESTDSDY